MNSTESHQFKLVFLRATFLTLFLVLLYRLGIYISIPFINYSAIKEYFKVYEYFSDGFIERISIFALGLMPYVSAYILVEILSLFIPPLKRLRTGDFKGRMKLKKIALFVTLLLGIVHGAGIINGLTNMYLPDGTRILDITSNYEYVCLVVILVGSTYVLIGITELISRFGVGHGISVLILSGICIEIAHNLKRHMAIVNQIGFSTYPICIVLLGAIAVSAVVLLKNKISLPINHKLSERPLNVFQFNTCPSGKMALYYATSLVMLPATILTFLGTGNSFVNAFSPGSLMYNMFLVLFTFVFSYVFAALFFHTKRRLIKLRERGWEFPRPEQLTENDLSRKLFTYNFPWTTFLCAVSILPTIVIVSFDIPFYVGGASLYIGIAIGLDLLDRYNVQRQAKCGRLIKIAEFHDIYDASMVKKHLELQGVICHLQGYYHRHLLYFFGPYIDVSLMVESKEVETAQEMLSTYYSGLGLLRPESVNAG